MAILSAAAIADVAYAAGFRGEALSTAVAVALAESKPPGNSESRGDINLTTPGEVSVGLWQINWRPSYASDPTRNREDNLDPVKAARNAYVISKGGTTFVPWSMFTNGGYRAHLVEARAAAASVGARGGALAAAPSPTAPGSSPKPSSYVQGDDVIPYVLAQATSEDTGLPTPGQVLTTTYVAPLSTRGLVIEASKELGDERLSARVTGGEMSMSVDAVSQLTVNLADPDRHLGRKGILANGSRLVWNRPDQPLDATTGRKALPWEGVLAANEIENDDPLVWKITSRSAAAQDLRHAQGIDSVATAKNLSTSEYGAKLAAAVGADFTGQGLPRRPDIAPAQPKPGDKPESPWDVLARLAQEDGVWAWEADRHIYVGRPTWLIDRLVTVPVTVESGAGTDCIGLPRPRDSQDAADGGVTLDLKLPRWRGELVRPGMTVAVTWPEWLSNYPDRYLVKSVSWPLDGGLEPVSLSCVEPSDPEPTVPPLAGSQAASGSEGAPGAAGAATAGPSPASAASNPGAASAAGLIWPAAGPITAPFGEQRTTHKHAGIDIGVPLGTPVKAATAGRLARSTSDPDGYGLYVDVVRDDGFLTRYGHLSKFGLQTGDQVSQGQVIAYSGGKGNGNATGPCLHFETHPAGAAVDPIKFLPKI